jgi:hypothetical protein
MSINSKPNIYDNNFVFYLLHKIKMKNFITLKYVFVFVYV